ncbi:MAG: imidazoleglycerol-phosphate dehydratase HisB [Planctomycetes bacterium]|nr:imidazoleglycerol-phosphate dehydratase HisB [Planctomycetota bacterium]
MARSAQKERTSKETGVRVALNIDEAGEPRVSTGIGFFDHMLTLLGFHWGVTLDVDAKGDTEVDGHHTVEDVGIVLGDALTEALGDKKGINRYGFASVPMDEALVRASVDVSGRPLLVMNEDVVPKEKVGAFDTELAAEFLRAFANHAGLTVHVEIVRGANAHHVLEAVFKAAARALRTATGKGAGGVPSSKGRI